MPLAARKRWLRFSNVRRFYDVQPIPSADGSYKFSYQTSELPIILPIVSCFRCRTLRGCCCACLNHRAIFSYTGGIDEQGRPHGIGRWRDTQGKGETLKGMWRHGVPVGPFVASEQGSGFGFRNVQIGFATCCAEAAKWNEDSGCNTECGELQWGVAATETSINGHFYRHLPQSTLLQGPNPERSASWVLSHMTQMHMDAHHELVTVSAGHEIGAHEGEGGTRLFISGYDLPPGGDASRVTIEVCGEQGGEQGDGSAPEPEAVPGTSANAVDFGGGSGAASLASRGAGPASTRACDESRISMSRMSGTAHTGVPRPLPSLRVVGWESGRDEALLFIHGWISGHKNAHLQLAQFLNLSRLGPHVKPVGPRPRPHRWARAQRTRRLACVVGNGPDSSLPSPLGHHSAAHTRRWRSLSSRGRAASRCSLSRAWPGCATRPRRRTPHSPPLSPRSPR